MIQKVRKSITTKIKFKIFPHGTYLRVKYTQNFNHLYYVKRCFYL